MNITSIDILNIMKLQPTGYKAELRKYAEEKNTFLSNIKWIGIRRLNTNPFMEQTHRLDVFMIMIWISFLL